MKVLMKPGELTQVVRELDDGLHGAVVQKVFHTSALELWFELRQPGRSTLLGVCAQAGLERLCVAEQRSASPEAGSGFQQRLRKLLGGKKLDAIELEGQVATLYFSTASLGIDFAARRFDLGPHVPQPEREPAPLSELKLARELGARAGVDTEAQKRLDQHLKKLQRTRAKIAEEAGRGPLAEGYRRDGELLSRNLHAVTRGQTLVTLIEYGADGAAERPVKLDPKRTPKQQADWYFHQYKRLSRGIAIAQERLQKIDAEIAAAQLPEPKPARPATASAPDAPSLPYREYQTAKGQKIWVGRGAKHNDQLTFKVARPHHLWLHARGVPGAHVIVPLEKKQEIDQETLLDAAHLAFHHSDARGERTGEVSYTEVRYVRKAAAPGAVTFTRETTFWLRVEPDRLKRLLA